MKETSKNNMELIPYSLDKAKIGELKSKYMDITIPEGDKNAYAMVMGGLRECRGIRQDVDEWHTKRKADILKAGRHYDSEKKRIHALIEPIESHLKIIRKKEDDRIEAIRQEKIRKEEERVAKIQKAIEDINNLGMNLVGFKSGQLEILLEEAKTQVIDEKGYEEFIYTAKRTQDNVISAIQNALTAQLKVEAEDRQRKAEEERLATQRREQEEKETALKAEQDRIDDEKRKIQLQLEKARTTRLEAIGFIFESYAAEFRYINLFIDAIKAFNANDEEFETIIKTFAPQIEAMKEKQAKEEAERKAQEAEEKKRTEEEEKKRQEAMRPDREKILGYLHSIQEVPVPELSTNQMIEHMEDILEDLENLIEKWRERI